MDAELYYRDLYEIWFSSIENELSSEAKGTFLIGGYYSYDFPGDSNLTLIAINSIYFNHDNLYSFDKADEQMNWIQ